MSEAEERNNKRPGGGESVPTASFSGSEKGPGGQVGPYKLLSILGEGGFAVVYLAEQQKPVRRRVALKVIKPGMDSKQVIARFEAERQALALLDHPNIAQVYDAGTTEAGRPYFVMEHVKGISLTEHCDREKLGIEERLGLFAQVCEGVQHAHQKGIIHRDIKPSNVLVSIEGEHALPKIIDFGVAKAITQPLTERTLFTEQGQMIGTPEYMSPEQAGMTAQDIDTRSDIYSLGVLLYELLTGALPFDRNTLEEAGFAEIQRIIREEDPPRPSTKLSSLGEEATKVAKSRRTEVAALAKRLHRELEWIPLMAMRKERTHRYRTATELADDIQNYLSGAPLIAGPESAMYRVKKFVRRKRVFVTAAAAVAAAIVVGLVVSTVMYFRAEALRVEADQARQKEATARVQAEQAEKTAQQQRLRAERLLARAQLERGVRLLNEGNCLGLLDLLEVRKTADEIPDLRDSAARLWAIAYDLWSDRLVHVLPLAQNIAFSPDGRLLATAHGVVARLWNLATGRPHGPPLQLKKAIAAVVFSPDGKLLATHSVEGVSRLWDTATGQPVGPTLRRDGGTGKSPKKDWELAQAWWSAAFSPDGKLLATASFDGTVRLWKTDTGQPYGEPLRHEGEVWAVAFSPDGKLLASSETLNDGFTFTGITQLWEAASGQRYGPPLQQAGGIEKVAFSPDGKLVATMSPGGTAILWDVETGQLHRRLRGRNFMRDLAFSPDGKVVATASAELTAQLWDTATGKARVERLHHEGDVGAVAFSPDGRLLATGSVDRTVRLWDVAGWEPYGQPLRHPQGVRRVVFSPDGEFLAALGRHWSTWIWRTYWPLHTEVVARRGDIQVGGVISPNGKVGAIISISGETVQLWDTRTVKALGEPLQHEDEVEAVAFSPDGRLLATGLVGAIQLWDVATGQPFEIPEIPGLTGVWFAVALAFSPDGKLLASGGWLGGARVFEVATGRCLHALECGEDVRWVAFSPDGKVLATGSGYPDKMANLWDVATGKRLGVPLRHEGPVWAVAFSPDGNLLATGSGDEADTVRLWDVSTGPPYASLALPAQAIKTELAGFSSDGMLLVRRLPEGKARVWRLPVAPTDLREMQLRTWIALGAQRNDQGQVTTPWEQRQKLCEELRSAFGEAEKGDDYYVPVRSEPDREEERLMLMKELLEIERRVLGEEHPDTLEWMNRLARLYKNRGRYDEAESLFVKELEMRRRVQGEEHRDTVQSMKNLVELYDSMNNLIELYEAWGKPEKAEEWRAKLADEKGTEKQ